MNYTIGDTVVFYPAGVRTETVVTWRGPVKHDEPGWMSDDYWGYDTDVRYVMPHTRRA